MDEEEKRLASDAAFQQATGGASPQGGASGDVSSQQAAADVRGSGSASVPTGAGEAMGALQGVGSGMSNGTASDAAFNALDQAPAPGPLEYDPSTASGLPEETQAAFKQNWDDNLTAAKKTIEGGDDKQDRDALAVYTDHLVRVADDYQKQKREEEAAKLRPPADPYAAQRAQEARVAKQLGQYDLFSDSNATRKLYTPQTRQSDAYKRGLDGGQPNSKSFFDFF